MHRDNNRARSEGLLYGGKLGRVCGCCQPTPGTHPFRLNDNIAASTAIQVGDATGKSRPLPVRHTSSRHVIRRATPSLKPAGRPKSARRPLRTYNQRADSVDKASVTCRPITVGGRWPIITSGYCPSARHNPQWASELSLNSSSIFILNELLPLTFAAAQKKSHLP